MRTRAKTDRAGCIDGAGVAGKGYIAMAQTSGIDPKLLEILVCPVTRQTLDYDREKQELVSRAAGLAFPIRDGVPIMLVDEARRLDQ